MCVSSDVLMSCRKSTPPPARMRTSGVLSALPLLPSLSSQVREQHYAAEIEAYHAVTLAHGSTCDRFQPRLAPARIRVVPFNEKHARSEDPVQSSPSSDTTTNGIRVQAVARFLPDESDPDSKRYLFAYRIRILNEGTQEARLLDRHWIILDADNRREEVKGEGVVGKQPRIAAGKSFEYTSSCPLKTRWGTMEGSYTFER